jgi:hypothetical protein
MVVKNTPPGLDLRELLAQVIAAIGLLGRGAQRPAAVGEGLEELAVQVVAIGHQHHGRVLELGRSRSAMT